MASDAELSDCARDRRRERVSAEGCVRGLLQCSTPILESLDSLRNRAILLIERSGVLSRCFTNLPYGWTCMMVQRRLESE